MEGTVEGMCRSVEDIQKGEGEGHDQCDGGIFSVQ